MKKMVRTYKSGAMASVHGIAAGLQNLGILDKKTMREFDEACLTPIQSFTPAEIRALREREEVSQTVFARYLNVSKDAVCKWESGTKHPAGAALKLLTLVQKKGLSAIA
jgi:putative transcriptional regulator